MTRIYSHTIQDAPEASRPLLEGLVQFSPTGKLLNLHAQMAHSPAVLSGYVGIRQATVAHGTLDPGVRAALMLATAGVTGSAYAQARQGAVKEAHEARGPLYNGSRNVLGQPIRDQRVDPIVLIDDVHTIGRQHQECRMCDVGNVKQAK